MYIAKWLAALVAMIVQAGMPVVFCYHLICGNTFINVAAEDAQGIERIADILLAPTQYALGGQVARKVVRAVDGEETYELHQRFEYRQRFPLKVSATIASLPFSIVLGSTVKAVAFLSPQTRERHRSIIQSLKDKKIHPKNSLYRSYGINIGDISSAPFIDPPEHQRRPGDENTLKIEKEALKEIVRILYQYNITFWADCGTCLGAYRYGGIIPWDFDIDLAILEKDHDNVMKILNAELDPEKYVVQDWSGRTRPKTYLKVYVKETRALIDLYHFRIDPKTQTISSILSQEESIFLPESWKIRERRYVVAEPYDVIFPLKKAQFDDMVLPVPNQTKRYLQNRYGENIGPVKVFSQLTNAYEKDLSHPYWQQAHVK